MFLRLSQAEVPKSSSGDEATKVSDYLKAGDIVANIKAASADNDDLIWMGVDVDDASIKTERRVDSRESRDESWLLPLHETFLIYLASAAGGMIFLACVFSFLCNNSKAREESSHLTSGFRDSAL